MFKKARIKVGNDNRVKPNSGAKMKWEDIIGIKEGTKVKVLNSCEHKNVALVELEETTISPCGKNIYKAGTRRLVSLSALDNMDLDILVEQATPVWKIGTANDMSVKKAI